MPPDDEEFLELLTERERGFLTKKHKKYLVGQVEPNTDGTERQWIRRIRNRTREALVDFNFLQELSRKDSAYILGSLLDEKEKAEWSDDDLLVHNGIQHLLRFLYGNLGQERFLILLDNAIREEYMRRKLRDGVYAEPEEVKLTVMPDEDPVPLEALYERYEAEDWDSISLDQLNALYYSGHIDWEEHEKVFEEISEESE